MAHLGIETVHRLFNNQDVRKALLASPQLIAGLTDCKIELKWYIPCFGCLSLFS